MTKRESTIRQYGPAAERRTIPAANLGALMDGGKPVRLAGYAAVFNKASVDLGGFVEVIEAGAFASALRKTPDVRALYNHNPDHVLARTKSGTLTLREDDTGLAILATLPDTELARNLAVSVERGDIDAMSFAFDLGKTGEGDVWERAAGGGYIRRIRKIANLYDVSVVTYPAYPDTSVALRELADVKAGRRKARPESAESAAIRRRIHAAKTDALRKRVEQAVEQARKWGVLKERP